MFSDDLNKEDYYRIELDKKIKNKNCTSHDVQELISHFSNKIQENIKENKELKQLISDYTTILNSLKKQEKTHFLKLKKEKSQKLKKMKAESLILLKDIKEVNDENLIGIKNIDDFNLLPLIKKTKNTKGFDLFVIKKQELYALYYSGKLEKVYDIVSNKKNSLEKLLF